MKLSPSDQFGLLLMTSLRDTAIAACRGILEGKFDSPGHSEYQHLMADIPKSLHGKILQLLTYVVDGGINDFLYDLDKAIQNRKLRLEELGAAELHPNLFSEDGWLERFSHYPNS